jgi:hypothetical protein
MKTCIKCGSHAFNLYADGIDQGGFCDVHYWQGRAHRAEAQPPLPVQPEQEPMAQLECAYGYSQCKALEISQKKRPWVGLTDEEIKDCMEMSIQKTCRAIEAKLKEKNT